MLTTAVAVDEAPITFYDNDCVTRHLRLMKPAETHDGRVARMIFDATAYDDPAQSQFDEPSARAWASGLLNATGLSTRELSVEAVTQQGCRNLGVFAVRTDTGRYFAKRSNRMFEPVRLATLQMHLECYPREQDLRDRNVNTVWLPGDETRRARVMPLVAWDFTASSGDHRVPAVLPNMLFEHARGAPLLVPDPNRLDAYTLDEQQAFLHRAYALGVSLALLQVPSLQGSSRVHVFERVTWMHDDLHLGNMFFDEALERIELVDCIEMRRSSHWHKDLRSLVLHRDSYPVDHPLRQAWSLSLAEGYLSRTAGLLQRELRNAFSGTLIYSKPDFIDPNKRALIW